MLPATATSANLQKGKSLKTEKCDFYKPTLLEDTEREKQGFVRPEAGEWLILKSNSQRELLSASLVFLSSSLPCLRSFTTGGQTVVFSPTELPIPTSC